ncbi:hypothetical protein [Amycolatopsis sp. NPDC003676]
MGTEEANRRIDAGETAPDLRGLHLTEVPARVVELGGLEKRMFLRPQRLAQQQQEARCLGVFAVVPAGWRRITGSPYEIQLCCEEPGVGWTATRAFAPAFCRNPG